jgi:3-(3-hydroxy-phenyl)propionate hydroxylase
MRPAGRGPLDSLYFHYMQFEAPSDRERLSDDALVVIVGAGPIGMTAALTLARHGQRSVLLERGNTFNDGSRAICIARSTMQTFSRIGAVKPFLDKALPWTKGLTYFRGEEILAFEMPDNPDVEFRPMYNLQQQYTEQYLWEAVDRSDLIDLRWQSEVTGLTDCDDLVGIEISDPKGNYVLNATYVLAADGARSALRQMRGLRLEGENYEGCYVIVDIQMSHDYPTIRRALFAPNSRPNGTVLIHKQPDDIWRIDYQLGADEDETDAIREEAIRENVSKVLSDIGYDGRWELEWWSVYSANTLALADYRDGHLFFIGDSAHIVPIFGVRGLNNGIADAENIGWKLAWVLSGRAGNGLLDSYTPERRGATLDVFTQSSKSARFMTPPTRGFTIMRDAALSLALSEPWAGDLANPRQMTPYNYTTAPWTIRDVSTDSFAPGFLLPDMQMGGPFVANQLGNGFALLSFGVETPKVEDVTTVKVDVGPCPKGTCLLIRPDGYIMARWPAFEIDEISSALNAALDLTGALEATQ